MGRDAIPASGRAQGRRLRLSGAAYRCLACRLWRAFRSSPDLTRPTGPRRAAATAFWKRRAGTAAKSRSGKRGAGDLLLFRWRAHLPAKHAAILISPDSFVHAYEGSAVVVSPLVPQWRKRIAGVFTIPDPKID